VRRQRCGYCGRWLGGLRYRSVCDACIPLLLESGNDGPRCGYCGRRTLTRSGACHGHSDLPGLADELGALAQAERASYSRPLMYADTLIAGLAPEAEQATREREE
jgi:hypothetical protein